MNEAQIKAELAAYLAALLTKYASSGEAALDKLDVEVGAEGVQVIEAADAKLPLGIGAVINATLGGVETAGVAELESLEASGVQKVIALLTAVAKAGNVAIPTL